MNIDATRPLYVHRKAFLIIALVQMRTDGLKYSLMGILGLLCQQVVDVIQSPPVVSATKHFESIGFVEVSSPEKTKAIFFARRSMSGCNRLGGEHG